MPLYEYRCKNGHTQTRFLPLSEHRAWVPCGCLEWAEQIITAPLLVKVAQDVCYDSPIDGTPITNWHQRQEDLKRNGCREYDPEMKTDANRRLADGEAHLDKMIDAHVEEAVHKMPTATRGKLYSELTEQGMTAEYARTTPTD